MVDLAFAVDGVEVEPHAAAPTLIFKIAVTSTAADAAIENILLQCQLRIEPTQRRYAPEDHDRLFELFGETHRWSETLRSMLWTHASVQVPAFASGHVVDLPVPCSFDFNIAATKYFFGLERRRGAVVAAVQRHHLLSRRRRPAADGADPLEQRGNLPAAPCASGRR